MLSYKTSLSVEIDSHVFRKNTSIASLMQIGAFCDKQYNGRLINLLKKVPKIRFFSEHVIYTSLHIIGGFSIKIIGDICHQKCRRSVSFIHPVLTVTELREQTFQKNGKQIEILLQVHVLFR